MLIPQHNKDALHLQNKKKIMENENKHTIQALSHCNTDNFNFKMRKKNVRQFYISDKTLTNYIKTWLWLFSLIRLFGHIII